VGKMVKVTEIRLMDRMLLIGAPGIGKTQILKQLAYQESRDLRKKFIDLTEMTTIPDDMLSNIKTNPEDYYLFLRVSSTHIQPDEINALAIRDGFADLLPFRKLYLFTVPDVYGVLFIDELPNAMDEQMTLLFSILDEKEFSWGFRLSKNVKVVAAGNPAEWSRVANTLPEPLRSKLSIINVDPPTIDEWAEYMDREFPGRWNKIVYAYLKFSQGDFIKRPDSDAEAYPCPRSWTRLALYLSNIDRTQISPFDEEYVRGTIGTSTATKFLSFLRENITEKDFEKVLKEPESFFDFNVGKQFLFLYLLSTNSTNEIMKYSGLLEVLSARSPDMLVLFFKVMDKKKRVELLTKNKDKLLKIIDYIKDVI
jgi:hypothetical protein